ncbi:hypothetical protein VNI00_011242 [Paramarasmius palmivorus]|uniref:Prolyl 4-hydroxylase alpha subunit domain-containing protein n=1 Tax=Paramarasmius palmivorus TaxID=297713 RepID=A0AAW0CHH6_9AGAR
MQVRQIDFSSTTLTCYAGFYAKIVDNVFTPAECAELIELAASQSEGWKPAGLSAEKDHQTVHSDFRNSDRALVFNERLAKTIFDRLKPAVEEELGLIEPRGRWGGITGKIGRKQGSIWQLDSVNSRLSFLRYGPGHYFKPHCDGLNELENGALKSFVTLHLYLNDSTTIHTSGSEDVGEVSNYDSASISAGYSADNGNTLAGGATRFWSPDKKHFLDVEPKVGRVLIFQQRMLVHSGEQVTKGIKYTMRSDFMFRENAV